MIIQKYKLNLVPGENPVIVRASQYDNLTRVITFALFKDKDIFTVPDGCKVYVLGTKENKTGYFYECSIDHNYVAFYIRQQMTVIPGKHEAEIRIVDEEEHILNSANFIVDIEEAAFKDDTIISETDIPLLEYILEHIDVIYSVDSILQGGLEGQVLTKISDDDGDIAWLNIPPIPTKTSELENDSGFITKTVDDLTNYRTSANQDIIDGSKANDSEVVKLTGNQEIEGTKTFKNEPIFLGSISIENNANTGKYLQITTNRIYYFWKEVVKDWNTYINFPNLNYADKATLATDIDLEFKEDKSNKVTSISSASTDTEYPSAKCVYDIVGNIESLLEAI